MYKWCQRLFGCLLPQSSLVPVYADIGLDAVSRDSSPAPANYLKRRIIDAGRRRRPEASSPGGRPRAETPQRRQDTSSGATSGSGGRSGMSLPTGKGCLGGGGAVLVVVIIGIIFLLQYCGNGGVENGGIIPPTTPGGSVTNLGQISNMSAAAPFVTNYPALSSPSPIKNGQTWLVILYQDADDQVLEKDIYLDLNEAEKAGASDRVKIVAQVDRYNGAYSGDGNWTGTRRYLLAPDADLNRVTSTQIADLGELNMSAGQTLVDFTTWAIQHYPADKYVLILSDHGMGWPGGWTDSVPKGPADNSIPMAARLGDMLYLHEIDSALSQVRAATALDKFEMIGLDACLMAQVEVFTALEPHARYAVASEEVEPSLGWAYTDFLGALMRNPDISGAQLSQLIVQGYIEDDQVVVDDNARAEFLNQGSPLGGLFGQVNSSSAQQLARELGQSSTLTAVDLGKMNLLNSSLNQLAFQLQTVNQKTLAGSRSYAQSFTSVFGEQVPASYIDLGNFLQLARQNAGTSGVNQAIDAVLAALKQAVIAEKHGPQKPGATGLAIYFPNSQLYQNPITGAQSYTAIANRFAVASLWDDFLAFHYSGQGFTENAAQAVVPPGGSVRSPAAGGISISTLTASGAEVYPGQTVTLSADIDGANIGYIYLFVGYYDHSSNSLYTADQDYLESSQTRQVQGVYYPDWGQGGFTLRFEWEPVVFAISDGTTTAPALFLPLDYGRNYEEAVYTVDGIYTFAAGGEQLPARLYFINGVMRQAVTFTGGSTAGSPREVAPVAGDRFTVLETWLELDSSGQAVNTVSQEGKTLTFGRQMFTWETLDAAAGDYAVGFVVADLDGNQQPAFTRITVR